MAFIGVGIWLMIYFTTMDENAGWMRKVILLLSAASVFAGVLSLSIK